MSCGGVFVENSVIALIGRSSRVDCHIRAVDFAADHLDCAVAGHHFDRVLAGGVRGFGADNAPVDPLSGIPAIASAATTVECPATLVSRASFSRCCGAPLRGSVEIETW